MSASDFGSAWQTPLRWPDPAQSRTQSHQRAGARHLLKAAIVFAVLAVTLLDRLGLRVTTDFSVPPGMVALYGLATVMLVAGVAELNLRAALGYVAVVGVATLSFVLNASFAPRSFAQITSFLLLVVLYAPLVVSLRRVPEAPELWRWTLRLYVAFAVFLAIAGIAQFFAQFVFQPAWLFDYRPLLPEAIRASGGWNTAYSTGDWIKSNGFFMREPSIFGVAMAIALLCELAVARRKWVMALLALALLLSYSGGGLLCLAVGLMFPLGRRLVLRLLVSVAVAAAVYVLFDDALNLSYTVNRVGEIQYQGSSAYCRFVYPGAVALEQLASEPWTALLGHGPGSMQRMDATCADGHQTTYAKALFEYGLLGVAAFAILVIGGLNRSRAPMGLRAALLLAWALLGGNLLTSELLLLMYLFSAMWPGGAALSAAAPVAVQRRRAT